VQNQVVGNGRMVASSSRGAAAAFRAWLRWVGDILRRMPGDRYVVGLRRVCAAWPGTVAERAVDYAPETTRVRMSGVSPEDVRDVDTFIALALALPAEQRRVVVAYAMGLSFRKMAEQDRRRRSKSWHQREFDAVVRAWAE
jgi:hypothetical protein